ALFSGPQQTPEVFQVSDGPNGGINNATNPSGSGGSGDGRPAWNVVPGPGPGALPSGMPPQGEDRFQSNEVVVQLGSDIPFERVMEVARGLQLELISQHKFAVLGRTVYRFRILGRRAVREVINVFERTFGKTVSAQPSYNYVLTEDATMAGSSRQG